MSHRPGDDHREDSRKPFFGESKGMQGCMWVLLAILVLVQLLIRWYYGL